MSQGSITINTSSDLKQFFDQTPFQEIAVARAERTKAELAADYDVFSQRLASLDYDFDMTDGPAKEAKVKLEECAEISEDLTKTNKEGQYLLSGLEDLIEDLLFKLETIHHERCGVNESEVDDEEPYEELTAQKSIAILLEEHSTFKNSISNSIISCGATVSKLKDEISELLTSNPRARRQSRNLGGMLSRFNEKNMSLVTHSMRRTSGFTPGLATTVEHEQFSPNKETAPYVEAILKFVTDLELPEEESVSVKGKIGILAKAVEHFKIEAKGANQKFTEEQIKVNNLQSRMPKLEESRVRLSQKVEELQDVLSDKEKQISLLNLKIQSMTARGNKNMDRPPAAEQVKSSSVEAAPGKREKVKQPVIPKHVLKDILQASDKEVEAKIAEIASSNEAIRVVLVRKNKKIHELEGTIVEQNGRLRTLKNRIQELEQSIVSGTADAAAINLEPEEEEEEEDKESVPKQELSINLSSPSPISHVDSLFTDGPMSSLSTAVTSSTTVKVSTATKSTATETIETTEVDTQTEPPSRPGTPDLDEISFTMSAAKRRESRKGSVAMPTLMSARRRSSVAGPDRTRRKSSMAQSDLFGIGAASHTMTKADLSTIQEFERNSNLTSRTIKQVDDIAVLQKYIASMREQSEKGMEKVREFIAKEKTRNDAATRKLISDHEKILSSHKKEMNKIVSSIHRFKEMMTEILNGRDITQIVLQGAFKFEQSPLQLRIVSNEMLSSMEFDIYQALREKDLKIRDLSGRKRLEDKDLDRRIKVREKTVFSMLDFTNQKLQREKERVTQREQWVNQKIKTELLFEKQQEQEVQTIEKALLRFWKQHSALSTVSFSSLDQQRVPSPTPREEDSSEGHIQRTQDPTPPPPRESEVFESYVPRLYISVSDQRNNLEQLAVAHRAGLLSNLSHKLITNIIARWLELLDTKITAIFTAYIKHRRMSRLLSELMEDRGSESLVPDMNRAMVLHKRVRDTLDLQFKKLHVNFGKLSTYSNNMLEEEEAFFASVTDPRALKTVIRPAMLQINHNALLKKIMQTAPKTETIHVTFPYVSPTESQISDHVIPAKLEDIPVHKALADASIRTAKWPKPPASREAPVRSLLIPRLLQMDTDKMAPARLQKHPSQGTPTTNPLKKFSSGLPPIPCYTTMKQNRISYIPNICSMWSNNNSSNES